MELKHLRAFVVLAQQLHFGRAAAQLSIVQPALSMQIKLLESGLGVRLLDRNRHSVTLTEAGRAFLPEAQATLHQAARAADAARASHRGEIGRVRLGFVSSVLPQLLPQLIRAVHLRYPRIELELRTCQPRSSRRLEKRPVGFRSDAPAGRPSRRADPRGIA